MIQPLTVRITYGVAGLAIALLCGSTALAQESSDPLVERARDILKKGVADSNPDVRRAAVVSVSLVGENEKVVSALESVLQNDKDVSVRIAAIGTLASFKDPKLVSIFQTALKDPVPEVNFAAAKVLYDMKQPAGKDFLLSVAGGEQKATSGTMESQKRSMFRMLHTPSETFMSAAANAVPIPGLGSGLESAMGLAADPASLARAAAILMLASQTDAGTWNVILAGLTDNEPSVRAAAVHAIAVHNDPAYKQKLVPLLDDKKEPVKFRAAAGYLRLANLKK
jgi:HEAT repeat protein